jgi:hypothetical protein
MAVTNNDWKKAKPAKWNHIKDGNSSYLERFGYSSRKSALIAKFRKTEKEYVYYPVTADTYAELRDLAETAQVGEKFHEIIRNKYLNGDNGKMYAVRGENTEE